MSNQRAVASVAMCLLFACLAACRDASMPDAPFHPSPQTADALRRIGGRRIVFGHQSVGTNILEGLQSILRSTDPAAVRVIESRSPAALHEPAFVHFRVGTNGHPDSKLNAWSEALRAGLAEHADIAFVKFCYDDVTADTDAVALFEQYRQVADGLERAYPATRFVHVTIPLTTLQRGPKALIKRMLGRPVAGAMENVKRQRYNELVRARFPSDRVFDLAAVESTAPDGERAEFEMAGQAFPMLVATYTDDGGHLARGARERAAEAMVRVLAGAAQRP